MEQKQKTFNLLTAIMALSGIVLLWGGMIATYLNPTIIHFPGITVAVIGLCLTAAALLIRERRFGKE